MKRSVAEYVAICDTCQRVKAEHQRPAGLLQPLKIPDYRTGKSRVITIRTSDGVMFDIMTLGETPSVLMKSAKVAVCGSGG